MFCKHCGKELNEDYRVCPFCGTPQANEPPASTNPYADPRAPYGNPDGYNGNYNNYNNYNTYNNGYGNGYQNRGYSNQGYGTGEKPTNTFALIGFILSFFVCIVGLVFSIIGLNKSKEMGGEGHSFAVAGIAISSVALGIGVLALIICLVVWSVYGDLIWGYVTSYSVVAVM